MQGQRDYNTVYYNVPRWLSVACGQLGMRMCTGYECVSAVLGDQFTFNSIGLVLLHCKVEGEGSW